MIRLHARIERRELVKPFVISTGARTHQDVLVVELHDGPVMGRGAATGVRYLGDTAESLLAQVMGVRTEVEAGLTREALLSTLPAGGVRAALDAALWELEAARESTTVAARLGVVPAPLASAYTIVLDTPEAMRAQAHGEAWRPLLKIKLGARDEREADRMRAVRAGAPDTALVIDANAGWTPDSLPHLAATAAELDYALLEQPLPVGEEAALALARGTLPLCADESFQTLADLDALDGVVDMINIKLDKCGGLTAALHIADAARERGLGIFIGCMVGPAEAIAPAYLLAQSIAEGLDHVDLDGPFWLKSDTSKVRLLPNGYMSPIAPDVWGAGKSSSQLRN